MKLDFYVKCFRCGTLGLAEQRYIANGRGTDYEPPTDWKPREVVAPWALGANPVGVLLCRQCSEAADAVMGEAWNRAIHRTVVEPTP